MSLISEAPMDLEKSKEFSISSLSIETFVKDMKLKSSKNVLEDLIAAQKIVSLCKQIRNESIGCQYEKI